uniref:Nuclear pore complex protein n=1 Tax=Ciona savignyi TaxID=51511 RepID=H2YVP2_CIOSA
SGIVMIEGNPHRDLWKAACWAMSKDETYNPHERALYGALCGNLSAMLEVSSSWEDHLWSHYKTMVDMATERHVQQTVNIWSPWQRVTQDTIPLPDGYWRQSVDLGRCSDIFDKIESSYDQIVREEALNPFHFVQRCIILNDITTLMERCASWVDDASVHLLRFLVHVILFLRTLGVQLEVGVGVWVGGCRFHVKVGVGKIEAIEWLVYDPSQRCEAVKQSNAIMRGFLASRKHTAAHDVFMKIPVDSIEVLYKEWYAQADKDVPLPPDADNAIHEHLCMKAYLSAHTSFKEWFKHYHTSKPEGPEEPTIQKPSAFGSVSISDLVAQEHRQKEYLGKMSSWEDKLQSLCDLARDRIYNVLLFPTGWLVDAREVSRHDNQWRNHQMAQLRRICVPYLCNLLLTVLVDTRGRYGECGKLAHVLADEDYKLYEVI